MDWKQFRIENNMRTVQSCVSCVWSFNKRHPEVCYCHNPSIIRETSCVVHGGLVCDKYKYMANHK